MTADMDGQMAGGRLVTVDGQKCQLCHGIGLQSVRDVRDLGQFQKVPVLSLHGETFQKQPLSRTSRTPEASEPLFDALPETSCDAADPFWDGHEEPDCEPALEDAVAQAAREVHDGAPLRDVPAPHVHYGGVV